MGVLSGLLAKFGAPTADLYLKWSCADLIADGGLQQIAPTVFLAGRTLVVLRHDAGLNEMPEFDRLIFVIDDDWRAGLPDPELPLDYRAKLRMVEARGAPRLETAADVIVVSNENLQRKYRDLYPEKQIITLPPAWNGPKAAITGTDADHKTHVAILGARTHRADLAFLAPVIADLLTDRSDLRFTISGEAGLPYALRGYRQITRVPSMSWSTYLQWMRGKAFDIGLYRLADTEFNAARSVNKLLEYDMFGAAVIGSTVWGECRAAAARGQCLLLADDHNAWREAILRLVDNPDERAKIATQNRHQINRDALLLKQRQLWDTLL